MKPGYVPLVIGALLIVRCAAAEVYNCDGVWKSEPCQGQPQAVLKEQPKAERTAAEKEMDAKRLWLHDLDMRIIKVRRATGYEANAALAREVCGRPESSLSECAHAISETEDVLIDYMTEKSGTRAESKRNSGEKIVQNQEQNTTVVYVDNGTQGIICDPRRDPHCLYGGAGMVTDGGPPPRKPGAGEGGAPPSKGGGLPPPKVAVLPPAGGGGSAPPAPRRPALIVGRGSGRR